MLTSGISAEYGRFSGGVVNVITKSGGNRFSGSWRTNYDKPTWEGLNPYEVENEVEREDVFNQTHEATLGGPITRDRLWFFYSFRRARTTDSDSFAQTGISYSDRSNNDRNQLKLTATLAPGHTLSGQYMRNQTARFEDPTFPFSITPATQNDATRPNDLYVTTYRGSLSRNVFAEAQVSQKRFGFRGGGGDQTAIGYSPFITLTQELGHYNAPYFDATDPEDRNNLQVTGNVSWLRVADRELDPVARSQGRPQHHVVLHQRQLVPERAPLVQPGRAGRVRIERGDAGRHHDRRYAGYRPAPCGVVRPVG